MAVDSFVPDRGEITVEATDGGPAPLIGVGDLRRGRLRLTLAAGPTMTEGDRSIEVALQWIRSAGGLGRIAWPVGLNVVKKLEPKTKTTPKPKTSATGATRDGEVAFIWVNADSEEWTDQVVGDLQQICGSDLATKSDTYGDLKGVDALIPTIVLNKDFADWAAYRRSIATRASD